MASALDGITVLDLGTGPAAALATMFYADIDGHPDDTSVRLAMEELGFFSREVRILGVYPAHPRRLKG